MHAEERTTRRRAWLAAGLALGLVPTRLVDLGRAHPPEPRAAAPEADPATLALAPPDLLGPALRLPFDAGFESRAAPSEPSLLPAPSLDLEATPAFAAAHVPEPALRLLVALSLASAAGASRGTRRCPRWRRAR